MPRVLMISFLFPPMGGVGVQRTLKFAKYLPEFGWEPHVLTVNPTNRGLVDNGLLNEIPRQASVTRTRAILPSHRLPWRLREWITRWLLMVDEQAGWYPFAVRAGMRILRDGPVDAIYSTSTPYTSHLVARRLHTASGLPWVADFRDPWVGNTYLRFPTAFHRALNARLERQVIRDANQVVVVSAPMKASFCARYPSIDEAKITWLPNGYDASDFASAAPVEKDPERFTLVHTGSFYSQGRTSRAILEAVRSAVLSGSIPRTRVCLRLVGNIGKITEQDISELELGDIVEAPGFVSHRESIGHLLAADALLLIVGSAPDAAAVFTGKAFEYLAAGKPILCLANGGVASDLVRNARAGIVVPPDDVAEISRRFVEMYDQWQAGQLNVEPDAALVQSFERRYLAGRLAAIFDGLLSAKQP